MVKAEKIRALKFALADAKIQILDYNALKVNGRIYRRKKFLLLI